MCGPAVPMILTAAASAVSAMSQFQNARAEAAQYQRDATVARQQAVFESQRQQRDLKRQLARLHAAASASGVQSGAGSPLDIAANLAAEAELEPLETIRQGLIRFQDLRFGAKRTKSAATAGLLGNTLDIGARTTDSMPFFD
jgi:hypothetical protein